MKEHIKTLPHHPKRVIIISLIIAISLGVWGYIKINEKVAGPDVNSGISTNTEISTPRNLSLGFLVGGRIKTVSVKAGDAVKKGQILATLDAGNTQGALLQARAALVTAQANYQKIIAGATGTAIDVAKAAVHTAQVGLDGVTKQQNLLVANAHVNLLNSTIVAISANTDSTLTPPSITGTYNKDIEGTITLTVNQAGTGGYVTVGGIGSGTAVFSTTSPQIIGDTGLSIQFSSTQAYVGTSWKINIPNKNAPNYLANYNAYQSALETKNQAISNAQAALDQANASLVALVSTARKEDIAIAQAQVDNASGAVQAAEAAYKNTIITAPSDGVVNSVAIAPGQIAIPNAPAIEFTSSDLKSESRP